jgi:hypothetical protein
VLNQNYILTLTSDGTLHITNLLDNAKLDECELAIDLRSISKHADVPAYSLAKRPEIPSFIRFAQTKSASDTALSPFQLLIMTDKGELYTLCPLILQNMILPQEAFEDLLHYLSSKTD